MGAGCLFLNSEEERRQSADAEESSVISHSNKQFFTKFRMSKAEIANISDILRDNIVSKGYRKTDLNLEKKH